MIDPIGSLEKHFGKIAETDKIISSISKARGALKSKNSDKEKAQKELDKAIKFYSEQIHWRLKAEISILPVLLTYKGIMKETFGIRDQAKLTKQQSLFVEKCQFIYRDVSLNF